MICGIDEAGRGPVLGSLVIAGIACKKNMEFHLRKMGVMDSKKMNKEKREKLYSTLISSFKHKIIRVSSSQVDKCKNLNALEGAKFADIINRLKPSIAYLDCADVNPRNFRLYIAKTLSYKCRLVIEHKADEKYPIVSAASIIAKVERDKEIEKLKEKYGEIGSGYPSDPKTIRFLEKWLEEKGSPPPFARKRWKTLSHI
jgi:ribonuclease HII